MENVGQNCSKYKVDSVLVEVTDGLLLVRSGGGPTPLFTASENVLTGQVC